MVLFILTKGATITNIQIRFESIKLIIRSNMENRATTTAPPPPPRIFTPSTSNSDAPLQEKNVPEWVFKLWKRDGIVYTCQLCKKTRKRQPKSGWSNLKTHMDKEHSSWESFLETGEQTSLSQFFHPTAHQHFDWLDLITTKNIPFDCIDDPKINRFFKMKKTSSKSVKKIGHRVVQIVEKKIGKILQTRKWSLVLDG